MRDLDKKDFRLLFALDRNSRQTLQQLAKAAGMSKDAVKYRMERLERMGILKAYTAVIDTGKLGFTSFRLLLKLTNVPKSIATEIVAFLLENKALSWLVEVEGNWDLNTLFLYKTVAEMSTYTQALHQRYGQYIERQAFGIFSQVTYYDRAYLVGKKEHTTSVPTLTLPAPIAFDATDLHIVSHLAKDARASILDLAKAAQVVPKTAIRKIRHLENEGVIVAYRCAINLGILGYQYYKFHITTNASGEQQHKMRAALTQHPNVIYHDEVLGGYDLELEVQVKGEEELRAFVDWMKQLFSQQIRQYEILHYFREHRLRFFPTT